MATRVSGGARRVFSLILLAAALLIILAALIVPTRPPVAAVPYDRMKLTYALLNSISFGPTFEDTFEVGFSQLSGNTYRMDIREPSGNRSTTIDAATRRYTSGEETGTPTGFWIPDSLRQSQTTPISGRDYLVVGENVPFTVQLEDAGAVLGTKRLESTTGLTDASGGQWLVRDTRHFDTPTGLLLESLVVAVAVTGESQGAILSSSLTLTDNGMDNDGDGLTDMRELLITRSDPRLTYSSLGPWSDTFHAAPGNPLLGTIPYVVITLLFTALLLEITRRSPEEAPSPP